MSEVIINFTVDESAQHIGEEFTSLIKSACEAALKYEGFNDSAEISVTITGNDEIRTLNSQYRGIDKVTDVLSFPLGENGVFDKNYDNGAYELGDIVISAERAAQQAEEYGHSLQREIAFLTVHSVLHLLGYDHVNSEEEEHEMFKKQEEILNTMGIHRNG